MLAFTKRTPLQIAEAIVNLDCGLMTVELVQHFLQYLPNDAEIKAFRRASLNKNQLTSTDRLMFEIVQVPFYRERLNLLKFRLTFTENAQLLNGQMHLLNEAYQCLSQSTELKTLLQVILSVLNHLNSTPEQRILSLDDLAKIYDMKTSQTRVPVMQIVSQICLDRHPEVLNLKNIGKVISSASKIDLTSIESELGDIQQQYEETQSSSKKFSIDAALQKFLDDCQSKLRELLENYRRTAEQFEKTISYFTKQPTSSTIFLSIFANLIRALQVEKRR